MAGRRRKVGRLFVVVGGHDDDRIGYGVHLNIKFCGGVEKEDMCVSVPNGIQFKILSVVLSKCDSNSKQTINFRLL